MAADRPNILFIAIDDLRPELGCYGAEQILSPNIDRVAAEGVLFDRAYCQAPHCAPSRSSLLSGTRPKDPKTTYMTPEQLAPGKPTLPAAFRKAGYHTVGNGKIFHHKEDGAETAWSEPPFSLVNGPEDNNHMTFHDPESAKFVGGKKSRGPFYESADVPDEVYIDGQTCDKTIADLKRLSAKGEPFFLACGFVRPHLPFYAPEKYWKLYERPKIPMADNRSRPKDAPKSLAGSNEIHSYHPRGIKYNSDDWHRVSRHGYYACVSYADQLVGRLMGALEESGLAENTIVVIWGDHGWQLGEHDFWGKHTLLQRSIRVPLIIRAPGFSKGCKAVGIVELIDLYPTLCELAGIPLPGHLEGASMVPALKDPGSPGKEAAFAFWQGGRCVVTRQFTYTRWPNGEEMLYNLKKDPEENINLAAKPEHAGTIRKLREMR